MAPKRKSDSMEQTTLDLPPVAVLSNSKEINVNTSAPAQPANKKARVADASTSKGKGKAKDAKLVDWKDVKLDGEDEVREVSCLLKRLADATLLSFRMELKSSTMLCVLSSYFRRV